MHYTSALLICVHHNIYRIVFESWLHTHKYCSSFSASRIYKHKHQKKQNLSLPVISTNHTSLACVRSVSVGLASHSGGGHDS